jgi:hypothetical protein
VKSAIALTTTCGQNSLSSRAPSWPKLPKKYIFIALRSVMLDYPMDLCPAAARFVRATIALSSAAHGLYPIAGGPNL